MPNLSRSEAAYLLGVSTDTLRRWEKEGNKGFKIRQSSLTDNLGL